MTDTKMSISTNGDDSVNSQPPKVPPPTASSSTPTNGAAKDTKSLPAGIVPPNKASTAPSQEIIERYAPGSAPYWNGSQSTRDGGEKTKSATSMPRNLPVKRYDGEPLSRSDLQHNVLCQLFDNTERCFTNPRQGPRGPKNSSTWRCPVPVYPHGMARTCARASDEPEEERQAWLERVDAFEKAPFCPTSDDDPVYVIDAQLAGDGATGSATPSGAAAAGSSDESARGGLPPLLRRREGYPAPGNDMLTFKELYMEALLHSGKCTKAMRDKMLLDEEFAEDFAKVCLLVNVGRINTTLAFYPEMKTILRSYHPLPSLQRNENSRRHLQDAPRMKSLLKAVLLDGEKPGLPGSGTATGALAAKNAKSSGIEGESEEAPGDIADLVRRHLRASKKPPTSIVTVIFLLATHSSEIAALHFEHPFDFYTIFFPHPDLAVPSRERARVFMWLIWHYLEGGVLLPPGDETRRNPFDDDFSRDSARKARETWDGLPEAERQKIKAQGYWKGIKNPKYADYKKKRANTRGSDDVTQGENAPPSEFLNRILAPKLTLISNAASGVENADTEEEKQWGVRMKEERGAFLIRFQEEEQAKINESNSGGGDGAGRDGEGGGSSKDKANKKRIMAGGGSSYPLANILAAANAEKAAAAAAAAAAAEGGNGRGDGEGGRGKRLRLDGSASRGGAGRVAYDDDDDDDQLDPADALWELDLTLPQSLQPPRNVVADERGDIRTSFLSPGAHSLPRLAWRRILERAQRGVGDASYESDDEDVALDEARDERPRAEMTRILSTLRGVRTHRGEISTAISTATKNAKIAKEEVDEEEEEVVPLSTAPQPSADSIAAAEAELAELL